MPQSDDRKPLPDHQRPRERAGLDCAVHDEGVRAVEVEPAPVTANVPSKGAYAGSKASLQGPCPHTECPSHEYCVPEGAEFDQEYRIPRLLVTRRMTTVC